ncbi:hypothetical protein [Mesorhizobium kowhaii]|uniref:CopG family transcriptional regulator n=1 Tax=Mesorhizobium kowhaii TaxID=1300272 RepID=A0A2W7CIX6_9HYPH|nr:hypothetical protein [Mesorhizobium kowhaii]PZV36443.1 hypothetical protein B5V02_21940 [Mesorhizobium kowhaii]
MAQSVKMRRFTVAIDETDYAALRELGEHQKPPVNLQYMMRLAVRELLDRCADAQLPLKLPPFPRSPR